MSDFSSHLEVYVNSISMRKQRLTITLSAQAIQKLQKDKGLANRSVWIEHLIMDKGH